VATQRTQALPTSAASCSFGASGRCLMLSVHVALTLGAAVNLLSSLWKIFQPACWSTKSGRVAVERAYMYTALPSPIWLPTFHAIEDES